MEIANSWQLIDCRDANYFRLQFIVRTQLNCHSHSAAINQAENRSEQRNDCVPSSQFLCLSQSLEQEDLKTIKGIPIDTGVVIVCAKKTDSDGLGCSICVWPVLSDHAPVVETIPGYKHGLDLHVIHRPILSSVVFLEPTKQLFKRDFANLTFVEKSMSKCYLNNGKIKFGPLILQFIKQWLSLHLHRLYPDINDNIYRDCHSPLFPRLLNSAPNKQHSEFINLSVCFF